MLYPEKAREGRIRRMAGRCGYAIHKDRAHTFSVDHFGGYMLVDAGANLIVGGQRFDWNLEDIEHYLSD
ncbi:MAG: hypothetical protein M3P18_24955 [Actinomycetota bacterium]|nr:hypothetical protein [Actinomycetota bacterium]